TVGAGETIVIRLRLRKNGENSENVAAQFADFSTIFEQREQEASEFYDVLQPPTLDEDSCRIQRQALAGMLWSKQFYHYCVEEWLTGDPAQPPPPPERKSQRNCEWVHLDASEVLSMPDTWE